MLRVDVELGAYASAMATDDFFGANMLAGRDAATGTFRDKIAALGVTHLRWPGGGIAEAHFDLRDPDAMAIGDGKADQTLTGYLALCTELGMRPVIVLPTKRYAGDPDAAVADLAHFLTRLKAGEFGDARDAVLEIGNEYYTGSGDYSRMSAEDYAEIASRFATMIDAILPRAEVAVQAGKWAADDRAIRDAFDTASERAAVDTLVIHEYPWRLDPVADRIERKAGMADDWAAMGVSAGIYLSEWNVGSHPNPALDARHDYGHAQPSVLLEIAAEALRAGVDRASVWGVQQRNKTSLAGNEGDARIFAAGQLFAMMSESLPGKSLLDLPADVGDGVRLYAYESRTEITVFIAARDLADDAATVTFDLGGLTTGLAHVRGERMTMTGDPLDYRAGAVVSAMLPEIGPDGSVTVTLDADYDILRLTFARSLDDLMGQIRPLDPLTGGGASFPRGLSVEARLGEDGHDLIRGEDGRDALRGGLGNDLLQGLAGHDMLAGGAGNDVLDGGMGNDRLSGNSGSDRLSGGWGADRLFGGDGTDWLDGGQGDDRLTGGAGADVFVLSPGTGTDTVTDFTPGTDLVDLSGLQTLSGFDDLVAGHLHARDAGTVIATAEGRFFLRGIDPLDLSETDFLF